MKIMKKLLLSSMLLTSILVSTWVSASYDEISCGTDSVFAENSCVQCFDGWEKAVWDTLGLLSDIWSNWTSKDMYMLKQENLLDEAVEMVELNGASWSYEPLQDEFWDYSDELENLTNDGGFYTLASNQSIKWIESKMGYSIMLNKSNVEQATNIGLLKYVLNIHVDENGVPAEDTTSHSECVLFKSAEAWVTPVVVEEKLNPTTIETGPQEIILLLLALLLAGGLFFISRKKA